MQHPHSPNLSRYVVQSSDVISDLRVNVLEENSASVVWYKERFLSDQEIIEHIVHNSTSSIRWIIHRPKQGWYIRIRSPGFPPGVFIPLLSVPRSSPYFVDAALSFSCRTNVYPSPLTFETTDNNKSSTNSPASDSTPVHSYPPSPPSVPVTMAPSPPSIEAKLESISTQISKKPPKTIPTKITHFLLAPHSFSHVPGPEPGEHRSLFTRALSFLQNTRPSHSISFTLCALDKPGTVPQLAGPSSQTRQRLSQLIPGIPSPLLIFHDKTPMLAVGSITGLLEIDRAEERILGVDTSFWIAVALTYLEFLEERESYLAASTD